MFLLLVSAAGATVTPFTCPSVTSPPEARPYYDTSPTSARGPAWDEVYAWFDESCVVSCEVTWEGTCESASCVTAAGATLTWEETYEEGGDGKSYTETTRRTLEVLPPASAGLAWTSAAIEWNEESYGSSFGWGSLESATLSWTGSLQAEWPADGWFRAHQNTDGYSSGMTNTEGSGWSWSSDGCEWSVNEYWDVNMGTEIEVTVDTEPLVAVTFSEDWSTDFGCDSEAYGTWRGYTEGVLYGNVDEATWERSGDADGDGFSTDDCDDTDAAVNPCATEVELDGVDSNCDGAEDGDGDGDADGDGGVGVADGGDDCDDGDPTIYAGAPEVPSDGIDQDCDGVDLVAADPDADGDGADSLAAGGDDCDDTDPTVYVGAAEVAYDGIDQDCDGVDLADVDADGADALAAGGDDCDDEDAGVFVGATEVECDEVDQNCDGVDDCPPFDPEPTDDGEEETVGCGGGAALVLFPGLALLGVTRRRSRG
jgi:hypothetical protein